VPDNTSVSEAARRVLFTVGYAAVALVAVVAVGSLTFRRQFFNFPEPMLSFVLLGLTAGIIYASVQMYGFRYALLAIALFLLARGAFIPGSIIASAIYTVLVGFALLAGAYWQNSLTDLRFGRFISMGLSVGVDYALMTMALLAVWGVRVQLSSVWKQALLGAALGAAMGLAFELIDLIGPRPEYEPVPYADLQ
jgi:hypothetical protein